MKLFFRAIAHCLFGVFKTILAALCGCAVVAGFIQYPTIAFSIVAFLACAIAILYKMIDLEEKDKIKEQRRTYHEGR